MFILHAPNLQLPWYSSADEDNRFFKLLKIIVGIFIVLTIAIAFIPVPELTREQRETIPPQLAQVILEKKEIPKPPPPPPPVEEEPEPEPEPEAAPEPEPEPEPVPEPEPEPEPPKPEPVIDRVAEARDRAANSGLMQLQTELNDMRDAIDVSKVDNTNLSRGEANAAKVDRSIITSGARSTSGGVNTAALSRDTGGVALLGRETTVVESNLATRTGLGNEGGEGGGSQSAGRGEAEIRRVFEQNKGAIFAIYNRALRGDPTLQGRVIIELTIEPSGQISAVRIVSSELNDPDLESKILARIKLISFEPSNASSTVTNYSMTFLPN
ncbi:hypothetical protein NBRC116493_29130 [Aurantivibrio infirmus]